jgi:hypothetical protein
MKWQYLVLAALLIGAVVFSLWMATRIGMNDIEQRLTNTSEGEGEQEQGGFHVEEGVNIPMYLGIAGALVAIGIGTYVYLSRRQ